MQGANLVLDELSTRQKMPLLGFFGFPLLVIVFFLFLVIFATAPAFAEDAQGLVDYLGNPKYPDDFWRVSSPENVGMDGSKLRESLGFIKQNNLSIHSFLVIKNAKLVLEQYGADNTGQSESVQQTPDVRHLLQSTTKTLTSALIGLAIADGKIPGVKTRVMDYFRHDKIDNMDRNKRMLTIEDLLTMRSGLAFDENSTDIELFSSALQPNSSLSVLNKPMSFAPGSQWYYSSGNSQVLAEIIRRTTGKTPLEYAKEKIFDKIGIKTYIWSSDQSGTQYGGFGLLLRPRDLARFGYLYLKKGKWGNVSVVPEEWVNESTKAHLQTPYWEGYGYHCWIPRIGGFATRGKGGQTMYVFPDKDLIVVFTAGLREGLATGALDSILCDFILSALQPMRVLLQ